MSWLCKLELRWISEMLFVNQRRKNGKEQMTKNRRWEEQTRLCTYSCGNCYEKVTMIVIHTMKASWGTMRNPLTLSWWMHSFSVSPVMIASQDLSGRLTSIEVELFDQKTNNATRGQEIYLINSREKFNSHCPFLSALSIWVQTDFYMWWTPPRSTGHGKSFRNVSSGLFSCHLRANMWLK